MNLGKEMVSTAEFILGRIEDIETISVSPQSSSDDTMGEIETAIEKFDKHNGIIILTDMFGGTPSNVSLAFHDSKKVEVLTGINLPMIIKLAQSRDSMGLDELAEAVASYGRKSINVAGELLNNKSNNEAS